VGRLGRWIQAAFWRVYFPADRPASVLRAGQRRRECGSSLGSVIARRAMRPLGTEDRAFCKDAGVMASYGPS
jgi:hypothetical protein